MRIQIEGPGILKDAFTTLLARSGFTAANEDARVLLLLGDDWEARIDSVRARDERYDAVLLVANRSTDIEAAQLRGIRAFVHEDEPIAEFYKALQASSRYEAYHSPRLIQSVLMTVRRAAVAPSSLGLSDEVIKLSDREREIALQAAAGLSNHEIGERLSIRTATVRFHLHNVFQKLGIQRRGQLAGYVVPSGLPGKR